MRTQNDLLSRMTEDDKLGLLREEYESIDGVAEIGKTIAMADHRVPNCADLHKQVLLKAIADHSTSQYDAVSRTGLSLSTVSKQQATSGCKRMSEQYFDPTILSWIRPRLESDVLDIVQQADVPISFSDICQLLEEKYVREESVDHIRAVVMEMKKKGWLSGSYQGFECGTVGAVVDSSPKSERARRLVARMHATRILSDSEVIQLQREVRIPKALSYDDKRHILQTLKGPVTDVFNCYERVAEKRPIHAIGPRPYTVGVVFVMQGASGSAVSCTDLLEHVNNPGNTALCCSWADSVAEEKNVANFFETRLSGLCDMMNRKLGDLERDTPRLSEHTHSYDVLFSAAKLTNDERF